MRIIRNLAVAIIVMVCITTQGCNEGQQAPPAPKASLKTERPVAMNYNIVDKDAFTVMGTQTRVTSADENNPDTYTKIWNGFEQYKTQLRPLSVGWQYYGVDFSTKEKDVFEYVAGMSVHSDAAVPDPNLVIRTVPAARYAVFKCASQNIGQTYKYIFSQWLPGSRYKFDPKACHFEQYAPKEWMNRPVFIYIPIKPE